jgi:hypothetical protein
MSLEPMVLELDLETIECKVAERMIGRRQDGIVQAHMLTCCQCIRQ